MRRFLLLALTLVTLGLAVLPLAPVASAAPARAALAAPTAHRDGCHRWHSCPSDHGTYVCGDTGHSNECSGTDADATTRAPRPSTGSSASSSGGSTGTVYGSTHGTVVVNTDSLKLRSGPGATYSSSRSYARGTVLTYLGKASSGLWVHVSRNGVTGWMMAQYVIVR